VTAYRPIAPPTPIPDAAILAAVTSVLPVATTAWTAIEN
jgi:hypothetical protein